MIYTAELISEKLTKHLKWLDNEEGGERFSVEPGADLSWANLRLANLRLANLRSADLSSANLSSADLSWADLSWANLRWANLSWANLRWADLSSADLSSANLRSADLRSADLSSAKIEDLSESHLATFRACPESGAFIGWEKVQGGTILKLQIPGDAKRVNGIGSRKCRASAVLVLEAQEMDGTALVEVGILKSKHDSDFVYRVGEVAQVEDFDEDVRVECAPGPHFFITRQEAVDY